jgi:hypothetical protein
MLANVKTLSIVSALLAALVVASCGRMPSGPAAPGQPAPGPQIVGRVQVEAPGVYVNGHPVSGVVQLRDGDDVRTDGTGWATVFFNAGGSLRMRPNSDPLLRLVSELGCLGAELVAYIRTGDFEFQNVTDVCVCDQANGFCAKPESDFRIIVDRRGANITVSRGSLLVSVGYPEPYERLRVPQGFGMSVSGGKTPGPQRIIQ